MPTDTPPALHAPAPIHFDLRHVAPAKPCLPGQADEIVVCGTRDGAQRDRLPELDAARFEPKPPIAETGLIGDVKLGAHVSSQEILGAKSDRATIDLKLPF